MARRLADVQELDDELELTQFGELDQPFRNRLRTAAGELEMSLIMGRQLPLVASLIVTKTATGLAMARYTKVGELRGSGFIVRHSPTLAIAVHVSAHPPNGPSGPLDWDEDMALRFDKCFTMPVGGELDDKLDDAGSRTSSVGATSGYRQS
jgi:hypothetical protein